MPEHRDREIIDTWHKNAMQWTAAVRGGQIESRALVTNEAIVEAVLSHSPQSVLDMGCGEGWLVRALSPRVARVVGIDAIADLIQQAKRAGGGDFLVAPYEALTCAMVAGPFDVVVCNFSLIGKDSVESVFRVVPSLLKPGGVFIVQTLHPEVACGDLPYSDGWREGSWAGFSPDFVDPAPWYFRTIESWRTLFENNGFCLRGVRQPMHPQNHQPASIIFIGENAVETANPVGAA